MQFIWSQVKNRFSIGTSSIDIVDSMPVLPLSAIFLHIDATNTVANAADSVTTLFGALKSIQFRYRGTQIWAVTPQDLYRMTRNIGVWTTQLQKTSDAAGTRRLVTLCIPFGRHLFNPTECFPGVAKGETELFTSWNATSGNYSTYRYTLETLQLIGANPTAYIRATTIGLTPNATGNYDVDLPRAAPLLGIGLSQTNSEPRNATADVETVKVLADNQDYGYSLISSATARAMQYYRKPPAQELDIRQSVSDVAATYTVDALNINAETTESQMSEFMYMNFDPFGDNMYMLDGRTFSDLKLRLNLNAANPLRIIPLEMYDAGAIITAHGGTPASTTTKKTA